MLFKRCLKQAIMSGAALQDNDYEPAFDPAPASAVDGAAVPACAVLAFLGSSPYVGAQRLLRPLYADPRRR